jgi:RNA polymerase sigma factor (sigma-70 family)
MAGVSASFRDGWQALALAVNGIEPVERAVVSPAPSFLDGLRRGDQDVWRRLFEDESPALYRYAYSRLGTREDAEDVTNLVFAKAWNAIERYRDEGLPVRAWLFGIARRIASVHRRPAGRRQRGRGERGPARPRPGSGVPRCRPRGGPQPAIYPRPVPHRSSGRPQDQRRWGQGAPEARTGRTPDAARSPGSNLSRCNPKRTRRRHGSPSPWRRRGGRGMRLLGKPPLAKCHAACRITTNARASGLTLMKRGGTR